MTFYVFFQLLHTFSRTLLRSSDLGCHLGDNYIGCIAYADDIILLSASLVNLQKMLAICCAQGKEYTIPN